MRGDEGGAMRTDDTAADQSGGFLSAVVNTVKNSVTNFLWGSKAQETDTDTDESIHEKNSDDDDGYFMGRVRGT